MMSGRSAHRAGAGLAVFSILVASAAGGRAPRRSPSAYGVAFRRTGASEGGPGRSAAGPTPGERPIATEPRAEARGGWQSATTDRYGSPIPRPVARPTRSAPASTRDSFPWPAGSTPRARCTLSRAGMLSRH